jgi:L-fuculose-phosphate aldolase
MASKGNFMPKPTLNDLKQSVIDTCRKMNSLGINQGTSGNISVKLADRFYITASGIPYENMQLQHIVEMDQDGGYYGNYLPSSEWRMHQDIFNTFEPALAVVHTHSNYAAALSCVQKEVPAFHYMIGVTGGSSLRCARYATFGSKELSENMLDAMRERNSCLLSNHGMICFGPSLEKALALAVEIESLCKQYVIARQIGNPVILDDDEMTVVMENNQMN